MTAKELYTAKDKQANERATIATAITAIIVIIALLLITFRVDARQENQEEGILVNFGTSNVGSGKIQPEKKAEKPKIQPAETKNEQKQAPKPQVKPKAAKQPVKQEPVLTQKEETAVVSKPKTKPQKQVEDSKDNTVEKPQPKPVTKPSTSEKSNSEPVNEPKPQPKQPDRLYKSGGSKNTNSSGEGNDTKAGDKGQPDGSSSKGAYEGTNSGLGKSGVGYSLSGRKLIQSPTITDNSNIEGKVTVNIKVDQTGKVIAASLGKPTTISNNALIQKSIAAAKRAKFDANRQASEEQFGTMTFVYKVR